MNDKLTYKKVGTCPGGFSYAFCDGCDGTDCPSGFKPNAPQANRQQKTIKEKKK